MNRTQAGSPCYFYAVASSLSVHGESYREGSETALDSPESQRSTGFQPVFCSHHQMAFLKYPPFFRNCTKIRVSTLDRVL